MFNLQRTKVLKWTKNISINCDSLFETTFKSQGPGSGENRFRFTTLFVRDIKHFVAKKAVLPLI